MTKTVGKPIFSLGRSVAMSLLVVWLAGCASTRVTLSGGDLTRQQLENGGLAFGGMTVLGDGDFPEADAASRRIEDQFHAHRPLLAVTSLAKIREGFAQGDYQKTLMQLSQQDHWAPGDVAPFDWITNTCRYLLLVNVSGLAERRYTDYVSGFLVTLMFGRVNPDDEPHYDRVKVATRKVEVTFYVFDLKDKKLIWLATASSKLNAVVDTTVSKEAEGPVGPKMPPIFDAIVAASEHVANRLPR